MRAMILLAWVALGLPTGFIAQSKGYGGCSWMLAGVLLGPLGLLIAIVMRPILSLQSEQDLKLQGRARCPLCREVIMIGAVKCGHCGEKISSEPAPEVP